MTKQPELANVYRTTDALAELEQDDDHSLRALCNTAVSDGTIDADENLNANQNARQGRVQHIHDLLVIAVVGEDHPTMESPSPEWFSPSATTRPAKPKRSCLECPAPKPAT